MENMRNYIDVKLLTKWDSLTRRQWDAKPNFHSRNVFTENLIAVELRKFEVKFNKPIYVGMCIFNISKVCLYEFHHEYMLPLFRDKCKWQMLCTTTQTFLYTTSSARNVYETIKCDIARFDTSDYPTDNIYGMSLVNKKISGREGRE